MIFFIQLAVRKRNRTLPFILYIGYKYGREGILCMKGWEIDRLNNKEEKVVILPHIKNFKLILSKYLVHFFKIETIFLGILILIKKEDLQISPWVFIPSKFALIIYLKNIFIFVVNRAFN